MDKQVKIVLLSLLLVGCGSDTSTVYVPTQPTYSNVSSVHIGNITNITTNTGSYNTTTNTNSNNTTTIFNNITSGR